MLGYVNIKQKTRIYPQVYIISGVIMGEDDADGEFHKSEPNE